MITISRRQFSPRGFTLIEVVMALVLAAMLAVALHGAMSTAWRAKRVAEAAIEPAKAGAIAMDIICRDLASAPPLPSSDSTTTHLGGPFTGTHQAVGSGDNDDLEFHTLVREEGKADDDPLADGMHIVEYLVLPDSQSPTLIRRVTRDILAPQEPVPVDEVISRNVHGLSFKYFDGTTWQTDWDSTALGDVLPLAVQVTIQLNDPTVTQATAGTAGPGVREVSRIVPLPCAKVLATATAP